MSWPIPAPADISDRYSSALELAFAVDDDGNPQAIDARSSNSVLGVMAREHGMDGYEQYLFQANQAKELFPDTAVMELARHGKIWGVPRVQAQFGIGPVTFTGAPGTQIPAETRIYTGSTYWDVDATVEIASGATTVSAQVTAEGAGAAGNLPAGTVLSLLSPIGGLTAQTAVVGIGGIQGGADIQTLDAWRAAILAKIRQPPAGGNKNDYTNWAKTAGAAFVGVQPLWVGPGSVGIIIVMPGPRAPTSDEIAAVQAYINTYCPVTAEPNAYVLGGVLTPVPMQIALNPDSAAARIAVQAAVDLFYQSDPFAAAVEGTVYRSRLSDAISSVAGETSHTIFLPNVDATTVTATQMPVTSTITWGAPA
jgi:uncharacterized phage protein gp47/JayE